MSGIKFNKQDGGLSRPLPGEAHISGMLIYGETAIAKVLVLGVSELEALGITALSHPVTFYHVNEYFRINPGSKLYLQVIATSDGTYTEAKLLQNFADSKLRQCAVCDFKSEIANVANRVATLGTITQELFDAKKPLSVLLSMKVAGADIATLPDLHTLNAPYVSVVLGQDGAGLGNYLATANPSLSAIGTILGTVSKAKIHESPGWVEKQNVVTTAYEKALTGDQEEKREFETLALCDASLVADYTDAQIKAIQDKGYLFLVKEIGIEGSYLNDGFTCTALNSDYAYIESNRVISEVIRELQRVLVPKVKSPLYVDPDTGFLTELSASVLESYGDQVLSDFKRAGNISGWSFKVVPEQKPQQTSSLIIDLKIVGVGVLREVIINLGLALTAN